MPEPETPLDGFVYVALQELATRIAHHNTGKLLDDPAGYEVMKKVASDENRHYLFYRDLVHRGARGRSVRHGDRHRAPGAHLRDARHRHPRLRGHAKAIAKAGIYDFAVHHDQILVGVVVRHWKIADLTGLTPEGEAARDSVLARIDRVGKLAAKMAARRERTARQHLSDPSDTGAPEGFLGRIRPKPASGYAGVA